MTGHDFVSHLPRPQVLGNPEVDGTNPTPVFTQTQRNRGMFLLRLMYNPVALSTWVYSWQPQSKSPHISRFALPIYVASLSISWTIALGSRAEVNGIRSASERATSRPRIQ